MKRLILGLSLLSLPAAAASQQYRLETVADQLTAPWCLAFLPDGRFLVTELGGQLKRLDTNGEVEAVISGQAPMAQGSVPRGTGGGLGGSGGSSAEERDATLIWQTFFERFGAPTKR